MNGTTSGFFAVIFLIGAILLAQAFSIDIASAGNSSMNGLSVDRQFDSQYGYGWTTTSQPRLDTGVQPRYLGVSAQQCYGGCYSCGVPGYDQDVSARDCDRCSRCPFVSGYQCDLYTCRWVRDYDCGSCRL
jgi:hypothetical protein